MEEQLASLQTKLKIGEAVYLLLFLASLAMLVVHSGTEIWGLTLGGAVMTRVLFNQPLRSKIQAYQIEMNRVHDRLLVNDQVESVPR
jgi:hypothetical protein